MVNAEGRRALWFCSDSGDSNGCDGVGATPVRRRGNDVVIMPRAVKPWRPTWLRGGWGVAHPVYGIISLTDGRNSESRAHAVCVALNRIYGVDNTRETIEYIKAEDLLNE